MIERYTREQIGAVWSEQAKLDNWLAVEIAVCDALFDAGVIPAADLVAIKDGASFTVAAVKEREEVTNHDVAAFVDVISDGLGEAGRWIHYGLTSSDVLDTALGLQITAAGEVVLAGARGFADVLTARAHEFEDAVAPGRTHGVHAEPTTFGVKLAGFAFEARRNVERLERAFDQCRVGALSGAVGTYSANGPEIEAAVLEKLGLAPEPASTQVVARDRHAELLCAIAVAGAGLERFATEIRALQKTEVREVEEPFASGKQKGSSAMPHKRNPIVSERIAGLARVLRGNAGAALENVALWHERDITHSSVERIILPDSTILLDYMYSLAIRVAEGMAVHTERMLSNLNVTFGALYSQRALLALVAAGLTRDDAYRIVQQGAQQAWDTGVDFRDLLAAEVERQEIEVDIDAIFDPTAYTKHAHTIVARLDSAD